MTTDITRSTFAPAKHYSGVRLQQGRVQVDADWNEQVDIRAHHDRTLIGDLVGGCGVPQVNPGFKIITDPATLPEEEQERLAELGILPLQDGDFLIGVGHAYVDGVLCENGQVVTYSHQPDLPELPPIERGDLHLVYLRTWQRPITALEDEDIRETALDGPDHATRTKTVWQVGVLDVSEESEGAHCLSEFAAWDDLTAAPTGLLTARGEPAAAGSGPCIVPPEAGFRRLENQLYRVEIHRGSDDPLGPTFKWSRINGSCVQAWTGQDGANDEIMMVAGTGPDDVLGFAGGGSVELSDDSRELLRRPGTIVKLVRVEGDTLVIDPASRVDSADSILRADFMDKPKIRRWDSAGEHPVEVPATNGGFIALEDGVEVRFEDGEGVTYRSGDYWLIPARTLSGDIEWPRENDEPAGDPLPQPPHGVEDRYCRLALLEPGEEVELKPRDCRLVFPPVTALTSLFYVGGDGQEATPNPLANPTPGEPGSPYLKLPNNLEVGVANGTSLVGGATVQFTRVAGTGRLNGGNGPLRVETDLDTGIASCTWEVDSGTPIQRVEATLLNAADEPVHLPIRFTARLNTAGVVAYDPKAGGCEDMAEAELVTVQDAIDFLCKREGSGPEEEPGIHIEDIRLNNEKPLVNDGEVAVPDFLQGFFIIVDEALDPATVSRPTCFVTIETPFPLGPLEWEMWGGTQLAGYRPLVLEAAVKAGENRIDWAPVEALFPFFERLFEFTRQMEIEFRLLARLTLKGNFIHDREVQLYLDGEAFGTPAGATEHNVILPSGDRRRGGDFEMWFWLTQG